jgi:hypothetical protein
MLTARLAGPDNIHIIVHIVPVTSPTRDRAALKRVPATNARVSLIKSGLPTLVDWQLLSQIKMSI